MKFQDVFLVPDFDGTLIGTNHTIPQRSIDAIRWFQEQDGHFAVATGRSVNSGERYCHQVQPRGFRAILNGSILYDYKQGEIAKTFSLPPQARDYARLLTKYFPEIGCKVFTQRRQFVPCTN